eukprot:7146749-Prymnesium_polylepis.1
MLVERMLQRCSPKAAQTPKASQQRSEWHQNSDIGELRSISTTPSALETDSLRVGKAGESRCCVRV